VSAAVVGGGFTRSLTWSCIALALASALCLAALHVVSPELDPSWQLVSEYAYGSYGLLLRAFFFGWGLGSVALALAVVPLRTRWWHGIGALLVLVSGLGALGGGLFDIRHPLHGASFARSVSPLCQSARSC
jgi:Protein of unknown function (DUF998)